MNKVWTYLISKPLTGPQLEELQRSGAEFVSSWTAHDNKLQASFEIYKDRIIIVQVNEEVANASGCSIDKLLRFIKNCEQQLNVQLLNRLLVAYDYEGEIKVAPSAQVPDLLKNKEITETTLIYDVAISNGHELSNWLKPLRNTWLSKYLNT